MRSKRLLVLAGMAALLSACDRTRLDAGSNDGPDAAAVKGYVYSGTPSNSYGFPCNSPAPSWLAGTWEGRLDSYVLPSGSSSVRIDVTGAYDADGGCGTITFGSGPPLPLPTDPSLPPPGAPSLTNSGVILDGLLEGFPYEFGTNSSAKVDGGASSTPESPAIEGRRIRTGFNIWQFYMAWCNMQPAYPASPLDQEPVSYTCVPPALASTDSNAVLCDVLGLAGITVRPGTCARAGFCANGVCDCYGPGASVNAAGFGGPDEGCTASTLNLVRTDLTVSENKMSGSIVLISGVEPMHLTRLSPGAN